MRPPDEWSRRRVLGRSAAVAAGLGLAGCPRGPTATETSPSPTTSPPPAESGTSIPADRKTEPAADLDLREANVVAVAVDRTDGRYEFRVTLHHDDNGEPGYANWWQVEALDGTVLGRRDLAHPHSQQPFTRSAAVVIPDGVTCVVVRGHDETHGYGGRAMGVDLETGATLAVEQGAERAPIDESDCPA